LYSPRPQAVNHVLWQQVHGLNFTDPGPIVRPRVPSLVTGGTTETTTRRCPVEKVDKLLSTLDTLVAWCDSIGISADDPDYANVTKLRTTLTELTDVLLPSIATAQLREVADEGDTSSCQLVKILDVLLALSREPPVHQSVGPGDALYHSTEHQPRIGQLQKLVDEAFVKVLTMQKLVDERSECKDLCKDLGHLSVTLRQTPTDAEPTHPDAEITDGGESDGQPDVVCLSPTPTSPVSVFHAPQLGLFAAPSRALFHPGVPQASPLSFHPGVPGALYLPRVPQAPSRALYHPGVPGALFPVQTRALFHAPPMPPPMPPPTPPSDKAAAACPKCLRAFSTKASMTRHLTSNACKGNQQY
jgi:hypothetical protein